MISYISGIVEYVSEDKIVIDNNGMGYGIFMPTNNLQAIGIGEQLKIFTYLHVKEDAMQLFGFLSQTDLESFKLLIGVSGVGPKGALNILSNLPDSQLQLAIIAGDEKAISKSQGIGKKTAQKIILELKDKVDITEFNTDTPKANIESNNTIDAVSALVSLGYSQSQAYAAINQLEITSDMDVDEILKLALKKLI